MSKRNRDRRSGWVCPKCGIIMMQREGEKMEAERLRLIAEGKVVDQVVHGCGKCKQLSYFVSGRLRPLTQGELFEVAMHSPALLETINDHAYTPNSMVLSLFEYKK